MRKTHPKLFTGLFVLLGLFGLGAVAFWWLGPHHGMAGLHHPGAGTMMHDEVNMPGLNGVDISATEIADLKALFQQHPAIRRQVELLPDGVATITETDDLALRPALVTHVVQMVERLQQGRNPQVIIQSPTLDQLFEQADQITNVISPTATGIAVTQTSDNTSVAKLLQQHAGEVSAMAERGMQAVHERMMLSGHQHE